MASALARMDDDGIADDQFCAGSPHSGCARGRQMNSHWDAVACAIRAPPSRTRRDRRGRTPTSSAASAWSAPDP